MKFHALPRAAVFSLCVFLSACGGGGDDPAPAVTELPSSVSVTSATTADVDTAATFTTNITGPISGLTFAWNFGDGSNSSAASPTHVYAAGGEYVVTLTVTNESGATRSTSTTLVANRTSIVKGSTCTGSNSSGWCWQRPTPTGSAMLDVFFIDASTGWAVGEVGQILKTTDGGATWVGQHSGVSVRLTQVRFADAASGWAVGDQATIVKTTDGGATWAAQASGVAYGSYSSYSLKVLDASRAVLYGPNGNTRTTVDGGDHWNASALVSTLVTPNATMWAVQGSTVVKSADFGRSSTASLVVGISEQIVGIDFADDAHGWAYGYTYLSTYPYFAETMWRTQDGGVTWVQLPATGFSTSTVLKFTSANVGWAMSYGSGLYRSTNGGTDWSAVALPAGVATFIYSSLALDDTTYWLPYGNGGYLTRDAGASWTLLKVDADTSYATPRLQLTPGGTMWLYYGTRAYRSVDQGVTWQQALGQDVQDKDASLLAAWFFDSKKGLAVSSAGWLVETGDSGQTWTRKANAVAPYGSSRLQFSSATTGWMLNANYSGDSIGKTTDGGASWWVPLAPVDFGGLADFHFVDAQAGWAVGRSGAISNSTDGGQSWARQVALPYYLTSVRFASSQTGVVVGLGGVIARTADAGATWTIRPSGVVLDLKRVTFADANTAWAVGAYGTVVKTTDAGISWSKVAVPSTNSLNDVVFADAQHGWIVGDGGTVLATNDGGHSWALQTSGTDKSLLSAVFIDSRTGWLVGAGGSILATATGGN